MGQELQGSRFAGSGVLGWVRGSEDPGVGGSEVLGQARGSGVSRIAGSGGPGGSRFGGFGAPGWAAGPPVGRGISLGSWGGLSRKTRGGELGTHLQGLGKALGQGWESL